MKQLMLVIAISIISVAALACGPAVGRAVGDAQVDVDATLADMGEPTTEAEIELYGMIKEIDRLHKEEREELLEALDDSSMVINNLIGVIDQVGNELDEDTIAKIGSIVAGGQDIDEFFQGMREEAYQAQAREKEINQLLDEEQVATWDRVKHLNGLLEEATEEISELKVDLEDADADLAQANLYEDEWIESNQQKEEDIDALEANIEETAAMLDMYTALMGALLDEDNLITDEQSDYEKSLEEAGRYQATSVYAECIHDVSGGMPSITDRQTEEICENAVLQVQDAHQNSHLDLKTGEVEMNAAATYGDERSYEQQPEVLTTEGTGPQNLSLWKSGAVIQHRDSEPEERHMALIGKKDVKEAIEVYANCARTAAATTATGNLEECHVAASDIDHNTAGNGTSVADHIANKLGGDNFEARKLKQFMKSKSKHVRNADFTDAFEGIMYGKGQSEGEIGDGIRKLGKAINDHAKCDPEGITAPECSARHHFDPEHDKQRDNKRNSVPADAHWQSRVHLDKGEKEPLPKEQHHVGVEKEATWEDFDKAFTKRQPNQKRVDDMKTCFDSGDRRACKEKIEQDLQEERAHHENFDHEAHVEHIATIHNEGYRYDETKDADGDGYKDEYHHGHGAGDAGHEMAMECFADQGVTGQGSYNDNGEWMEGKSYADAADACYRGAGDMMKQSYGGPKPERR